MDCRCTSDDELCSERRGLGRIPLSEDGRLEFLEPRATDIWRLIHAIR